MTTIRVARRQRYTSIDRRTIQDSRISFRALGVLAWLLDKPDDWQADADTIASTHTEGRDAVRTALRELELAGYLVRRRFRNPETQRWACEHTVHEVPQSGQSHSGFPAADNQRRVSSAGNPGDITKTDNEENTPEASDEARGDDPSSSSRTASGESKPKATETPEHDIATRYYEWVKAETGHPPAIAFMGLRKLVRDALRSDFEPSAIKRGLAELNRRGITITRQTLWNEMTDRRAQPKQAPKPKTNEAWVDDLTELQRAEHERRSTTET